jgi:RNA polymerase sigma factor (sigma-70 family)
MEAAQGKRVKAFTKTGSLPIALKDLGNQDRWKQFFDRYWSMIYKAATNAGLTDAEAQDVVQETVISVMKGLPDFFNNPKPLSFRAWLMRLTSWRITDQRRKRQRGFEFRERDPRTSTRTDTVERQPDPGVDLDAVWEGQWDNVLFEAALRLVKAIAAPKDYQLFDLLVIKRVPVAKIVETLGVSRSRVYIAKFRMLRLLKQEFRNVETSLF